MEVEAQVDRRKKRGDGGKIERIRNLKQRGEKGR
jgi:hypothetical protein